MTHTLRNNRDRLWASVRKLKEIGAHDDEAEQHLVGHVDPPATTADDLGLPRARAMSGAGHGAQELSAICAPAMVFVAGGNGGISHTSREYSNAEARANGTDVLANAALRLADQP